MLQSTGQREAGTIHIIAPTKMDTPESDVARLRRLPIGLGGAARSRPTTIRLYLSYSTHPTRYRLFHDMMEAR